MRTYILKRLLLIIPTLLGAATLVFLIMRVIPGDVALLILGGDQGQIDQKQLDAMRQQLGLDKPLWVQFGTWLWGVLRFDFGTSLWTGQPVVCRSSSPCWPRWSR
jgi:peptide/nickel transport system permease protein